MPLKNLLGLGFSPCPNDTYIFHALVHGRVPIGDRRLDVQLHDVETLNRMAAEAIFDITKLSAIAWLKHQSRYRLLASGAALDYGCGPLVVARSGLNLRPLSRRRVVLPGEDTTTHLLFRLWAPQAHEPRFAAYDRILDRLLEGQDDLGVIIHENRFTYDQQGCERVIDLNIGGALRTGPPWTPGTVFAVSNVRYMGDGAYKPDETIDCDRDSWQHLPAAELVTRRTPVFDAGLRAALARWGALVDMEGAVIAAYAHESGLPCSLIKGITDDATGMARDDLYRRLAGGSRQIASILDYRLRSPGPLQHQPNSQQAGS